MSRRRKRECADMQQASQAVLGLPALRSLRLANGRQLQLRRLDWLGFELLWQEFCQLLGSLAPEQPDDGEELLARLGSAPQLVLKLATLSSGISESELAEWEHGLVLELATAALEFNFIETAGLRDFSGALARLWNAALQGQADQAAGLDAL
ncbi:MAG: hypothetical protein R3F46_01200 [bacterium]